MKHTRPKPLWLKTILILLLLIIPLNVICLLAAQRMLKQASDILDASTQIILNTHMGVLDNRIQETNYLLYTLPESNECCIHLLQQEDDWRYNLYRNQTYKKVFDQLGLTSSADQIFFYMKQKDDLLNITSSYGYALPTESLRNMLSDFTPDSRWHYQYIDGHEFLLRLSDAKNYQSGALICLDVMKQEILSQVGFQDVSAVLSASSPEPSGSTVRTEVASTRSDLILSMDIGHQELYGHLSLWVRFLIIAFLLYLFLIPLLYLLFRENISLPLNRLNEAHGMLKDGTEGYRITEEAGSLEFYLAYDSFNEMAESLQNLRLEKINHALETKQLQLSNLQLQIRPHFLLNTMNLLYAMIEAHEEKPALDMVIYLSDYFRYMFRSGQELALLGKELSLVKEYLDISRYRYPDAFRVSWQIDPDTEVVRIPSLLLHNFVENILSHALTPERTVHIIIFTEYREQKVIIQIADDGLGMDAETAALINTADTDAFPEGTHVGIRNSIKRLKHYYGSSASVNVESEPGNGSTFTIEFPYNLDES